MPSKCKQPFGRDDWTCGPLWLRRRSLGKLSRNEQQMSASEDIMLRLKEEARLEGHKGCVNCLDWNHRGDQLASGSDDFNVILWDVFRRKKRNVIETKHEGSIFSVKFVPGTSDTLLATGASDGRVKVTNIYQSESLLDCNSCHTDRVKRLAVHPGEPNLIWSAAEDGLILEYDIRQGHICCSGSNTKPTNLLIDLRTISDGLQAKCIAANPLRSEMLAVGSNDIYNRLFDRRYIKSNGSCCTAYFAPGHLLKTNNRSNNIQTYGTTYLTFNSTGSELLASYHAEQVYLFSIHEPWERYQSFDQTLKPLLLDKQKPTPVTRHHVKTNQHLQKLRQLKPVDVNCSTELDDHCDSCSNLSCTSLNKYLSIFENYPRLYRLRSSALIRRGWRGDDYEALRDCCCALALDPMDSSSIFELANALVKLGDHEAASSLLEFIEAHRQEYQEQECLNWAVEVLSNFKPRMNGSNSLDDIHAIWDPYHPMLSRNNNQRMDSKAIDTRYEQSKKEAQRCSGSFDYSKRYCGHCNMNTDIKEASFFGPRDEFIVGGSDDGAFYIWNKNTSNIVKAVHADHHILNCVQPHPNICMLATSGLETSVKLWSPNGATCRDVRSLETRCEQNQKFISTDPLEAMILMLYPDAMDEN